MSASSSHTSSKFYNILSSWLFKILFASIHANLLELTRERDAALERYITCERRLALYRPLTPFAITDEQIARRLYSYTVADSE